MGRLGSHGDKSVLPALRSLPPCPLPLFWLLTPQPLTLDSSHPGRKRYYTNEHKPANLSSARRSLTTDRMHPSQNPRPALATRAHSNTQPPIDFTPRKGEDGQNSVGEFWTPSIGFGNTQHRFPASRQPGSRAAGQLVATISNQVSRHRRANFASPGRNATPFAPPRPPKRLPANTFALTR